MSSETNRTSRLYYHGTREEVRLGDRVRIRRWLGRPREGVVCYIPGISSPHRELEHEWAIQLGDGSLRVMVYSPEEAQPGRRIVLLARGAGFTSLLPTRRIERWDGWIEDGEDDPSGKPGEP